MDEHKKIMKHEITVRIRSVYIVFSIVCLIVFVRLVSVQFFSREIAINAERLRKTLIFSETLKANRGSILARDGRPLATSIFRKSIFFDFGSDGFDNQERFMEECDSLAKLLALYFKDKTYKEYLAKMVAEHNRCYRLTNERNIPDTVSWSGMRKWFYHAFNIKLPTKPVYDTLRQHSNTRLFRDVDFNEWQVLKTYPILNESLGRTYRIDDNDTRIYPYDEMARRTIGRCDVERPYGIEDAFRDELAGRGGQQWVQCVAPRFYTRIKEAENIEPEDGNDVYTTLDIDVQDVADKALREQLSAQGAIWGTSIVMECATGNILALVNLGRNPKGAYTEQRNYALAARLEPGSTFKLASLLALVDKKGLPLSTTYDSGNGKTVVVGGYAKIRDSHKIGGQIDMITAFKESANVYFAKAIYEAFKESPQEYVDFLCSLHLNAPMGLERFGEVSPTLPSYSPRRNWDGQTLPNLGYGYKVELAPIQTLTLYNAVANNGKMVAPRLIDHVSRGDKVIETFPVKVLIEQIADKKSIATARKCLETVALDGTAKEYFGEKHCSFRVGAKTGTAKVSQGDIHYSDGYYLGSMVTYFPADKPRYTIMTAIFKKANGKGTVYGAGLAGPVQKQIATFLYNRSNNWSGEVVKDNVRHYPENIKGGDISKIRNVASKYLPEVNASVRHGWGHAAVNSTSGSATVTPLGDAANTLPDVCGMGLSDALFLLENKGAKVAFSGAGKVVSQSPASGTPFRRGDKVTLILK